MVVPFELQMDPKPSRGKSVKHDAWDQFLEKLVENQAVLASKLSATPGVADVPIFGSSNESCRQWIFLVAQKFFDHPDWDDLKKIRFAGSLLRGAELDWFMDNSSSFVCFLRISRKNFSWRLKMWQIR